MSLSTFSNIDKKRSRKETIESTLASMNEAAASVRDLASKSSSDILDGLDSAASSGKSLASSKSSEGGEIAALHSSSPSLLDRRSAMAPAAAASKSTASLAAAREFQRHVRVSARELLASDDPVRLIRSGAGKKAGPVVARRTSHADTAGASGSDRSMKSYASSTSGSPSASGRKLGDFLDADEEEDAKFMPEDAIDIARSFLWTDEDDVTVRSGAAGGSSSSGRSLGVTPRDGHDARGVTAPRGPGSLLAAVRARAEASTSIRNLRNKLSVDGKASVLEGGVVKPASSVSDATTSVDKTGTVWTTFTRTLMHRFPMRRDSECSAGSAVDEYGVRMNRNIAPRRSEASGASMTEDIDPYGLYGDVDAAEDDDRVHCNAFIGGLMDASNQVRRRGEVVLNTVRSRCQDVLENRGEMFEKTLCVAAVAIAALTLVGVFVGAGIGQSNNKGGVVGAGLIGVVPDGDTASAVDDAHDRFDAIFSKILEAEVSAPLALGEPGNDLHLTPQRAALEWIANEDAAELAPDDPWLLQRYLLSVFFLSTGGVSDGGISSWADATNWMTEKGICSWAGVECAPQSYDNARGDTTTYDDNNDVTVLDLKGGGLVGKIPSEILAFKALQILDLSENALEGTLPEKIGTSKRLEVLRLGGNNISGTLPSSIGQLDHLFDLQIQKNSLSGEIPSEISNLRKLRFLYLDSNNLSGSIPPSIGSLSKLQELFLYSNSISGPLPKTVGSLTELRELLLNNNKLTGTLPRSIANLEKMTSLFVEENMLSSTVPYELGYLKDLQMLRLHYNMFTGEVPQSICNLFDKDLLWVAADCGGESPKVECSCCQECHGK